MSRHGPQFILIACAALAACVGGGLSRPAAAQQAGYGADRSAVGVQWQHDLESAKALAKQTGRLVLVHFWMPSCMPCWMLEQNVFNQPGVAEALQAQFVTVKLNANEHPETARGFGIERLPMDLILTADGQVIGKLISPPTPVAYVAEITAVARQHTTRLGGAYDQIAAAAPVPPTINAAYAGLHLPPQTPAALEAAAANPNQDRFRPVAGPYVATAPASAGPPMMATQSFSATANESSVVAPSPLPAVEALPPNVPDRYAQVPVTTAAVQVQQVQQPPRQISNPYAQMPASGAAPQATTETGAPAASASAPATAAPDSRSLPPNAPPLGFDGYCPVSMLTQWKWVPGDPRWGIVHRGRTYWFAGPAEQQQFWTNPDRYSPALSGMDPVMAVDHGQQVPGKREHSIYYENLFYMFASEATLQQFTSTPERYAVAVRRAMGIQRGRLVR